MKNFIAAIQFITILPTGRSGIYSPRGMIPCFPAAGILVGLLLCGFDQIAIRLWPGYIVAVLDVVFLVAVTGAFHLDGLGDMADGLFGHRTRERALEIMKDSRIGVMALAAIACSLAIKWGGLAALTNSVSNSQRALLLIIIPAYARGGMLFGVKFLPYGRPAGTGHDLFEEPLRWKDFWGMVPLVLLSTLAGWRGLWLNLAFAGLVGILLLYYKKRMNCITGDMLGAMTEFTESMLFLLVAIGGIPS